jgi:hypothetical protein
LQDRFGDVGLQPDNNVKPARFGSQELFCLYFSLRGEKKDSLTVLVLVDLEIDSFGESLAIPESML